MQIISDEIDNEINSLVEETKEPADPFEGMTDNEKRDAILIAEAQAKTDGFDQLQIDKALDFMEDVFMRSHMLFLLLGDTARDVYEGNIAGLDEGKLKFGVLRRHYTEYSASTVNSILDSEDGVTGYVREKTSSDGTMRDKKLTFEYRDLPVEVYIIDKQYPFFNNPQLKIYNVYELWLPNPFDAYWEERENIV